MTARIVLASLLAILALSPVTGLLPGWTPAVATTVAFTALALVGLNLIFGVTGMLAFGQAAFMVLPVYIAGVLERAGLGFGWAVGVGLCACVVLARILAGLFVRLPGIYLAFGTLGFGFVVEGLARAFPAWTGGASGLVFASGRGLDPIAWYVVSLAALALGLSVYARMMSGSLWRRLRTIRHDELVAAAIGIDVQRAKAHVFTIGCLYACIAGTLLCTYVGVVVPEDASAQKSLSQIGMVMMGGPGFTFGPVVGAFLVSWLFFVAGYGAQFQSLIYGVVFLLAVLYAKNGLLGFLKTTAPSKAAKKTVFVSDLGAAAAPRMPPPAHRDLCLKVEDVSKHFQGLSALQDVSFEVAAGEVFALVGPNGAGKSTLFNLVSGLLEPSSGTIALAGRNINAMPIHRRAPLIGRAFQVARLVPDLTAAENVMVRLDQIAAQMSEGERRAAALDQLRAFELSEHADQRVDTLSIGQLKLIDLARAGVGDPLLVLLDEPAVGLTDAELLHLAAVIRKLQERNIAIVIVEHNIEFVSAVASRGLVLDSGRPIVMGAMADILADQRVQTAYFGALT